MEKQVKKDGFSFTYSAKEQEEIQRIRQKYQHREPDKMEQVRKLDAQVAGKAVTYSLLVGVLGVLVMGSGMSFVMTDLGDWFGLQETVSVMTGIVVGVIGMGFAGAAYPVYRKVLKKEREKIAPEILRLTDELMKLS